MKKSVGTGSARYVLAILMLTMICLAASASGTAAAQRQSIRDLPLEGQYALSAAIGVEEPIYHALRESGALEAANAGQNYTARFGERGVSILSEQAGFTLEPVAWGRGGELVLLPQGSPQAVGNTVVSDRGAVGEWYVNGPLGLQQGFTVAEPPQAGSGPLTMVIALSGARAGPVDADGRGVVLTGKDGGQYRYSGLMVRDAAGIEAPAWLAAQSDVLEIRVDDAGLAYPLSIDPIIQAAKLTASDGAVDDRLGYTVAVSGDIVVAGAYFDQVGANANQGSAYIFVKTSGIWTDMLQAAKLTASDGAADDKFGKSVAISGDTSIIAIGAFTSNAGQGAVYIFEKPQGGWSGNVNESAKLTASDGAAGDYLGISVAISGTTVAAGAYQQDIGGHVNQGSAYIFVMPGGGWSGNVNESAKLMAADGAAMDGFGYSVSIASDTVVVGAPNKTVGVNSMQGAAYVFVKPAGGWTGNPAQTAKLTSSDGAANDFFGSAVCISGDTVVAGAPGADMVARADQGSVYVFTKPASGWDTMTQSAKLAPPDGAAGDNFGISAACSGDIIVAGALYADNGIKTDQGAAYVFEKPVTGWAGTIPQVSKLSAADGASNDYFGQAIAINGTTVAVGAPWAKVGNNTHQGVVYVFAISADEPSIQATTVSFSSVSNSAMTVRWTPGTGAGSIVLMKAGSPVDAVPTDDVEYTANTAFGSDSQIGTGNYAVYSGSGDTVTVTGLSASTVYYAAVYDYNTLGAAITYRQVRPATGSQMTSSALSAADDIYSTARNTQLVEAAPGVLANDTGAGIQAMLVTGAEHGTVALNADGSFIYIPESGYSGSDSFTYKLSDGIAESAAAMVTITTEAGGPCPAVKLYGEGSEQVEMLRQYRDEVLGQTAAGRRIIQGYYFLAASAEKMFEASPVLRRAARNTMDALLPLIQNRLN